MMAGGVWALQAPQTADADPSRVTTALESCRDMCAALQRCLDVVPCVDARDNFESLIEAGDNAGIARYNLGLMYDNAWGVRQDQRTATRLYEDAAERGLAQAQYNYGARLAAGICVPRDTREATRLIHAAAEKGVPEAAYQLGLMFLHGDGVSTDYVQAYVWLNLASKRGYDGSTEYLQWLQFNLGPNERSAGDAIVGSLFEEPQ